MNKSLIRTLTISDLHLGNRRNKTSEIIYNLRSYFRKYDTKFKQLDIIFLDGDVFDRNLTTYSDEFRSIVNWFGDLAIYCEVNNIKLRGLEGTPSHDWRQLSVISDMLKKHRPNLDFKYYDTLSIEIMDDLGISVLYINDEYRPNALDTQDEVKLLLKKNNIERVDLTHMHGMFTYQLPITSNSAHSEEFYMSITRWSINIGHVHTHSVFGRIIAQGSFDRLRSKEEEPKGGVYSIYREDGYEYVFLENTSAKIFDTIDTVGSDVEKTLRDIRKSIKNKPKDSYFTITLWSGNSQISMEMLRDYLGSIFFDYNFRLTVIDSDIKQNYDKIDFGFSESFSITPDNIDQLVTDEIANRKLENTKGILLALSNIKDSLK